MNAAPKKRKKKSAPRKTAEQTGLRRRLRLWSRAASLALVLAVLALGAAGDFYVHHPADWLAARRSPLTAPLEYFGDRAAFFTDALGWTGRDAVNTPDDPPPTGQVTFAGDPVRVGAPAPADLVVLDRGDYRIGWSPSLRRPVWAAYHVPRAAPFAAGKRPGFQRDRSVASSPGPREYERTGYDRGHMVPNHAIATRFGPDAQRRTFQMTNVAPQRPALNRGPWREMEQRIADLWTAKYGEIWVVVGAIPPARGARTTIGKSKVDVPEQYYMVVASQTEDSVRVLAVLLDQTAGRWDFPARSIVSVDEIERRTGLDFFPDMQKSLQSALEASVPTRLWPIRALDLLKLVLVRLG